MGKKIIRITLKVFMWIFICVFALILIAVIALQFPQTQRFLTGKAVDFLENKIKTEVAVGEVNVAFPKAVVLKDIYVEDQKADTLIYAHRIAVDIDLLGLISSKVQINNIELEKITGHVARTLPDSAFNFDFIIQAFASDSTQEETPKDTTGGGMEIKVMGLELSDINVTYLDEVTGTDAKVRLGEFEVEMDKFDLDNMEFVVDFINLHNSKFSLVQSKLPSSDQDEESQPLDLKLGLGSIDFSGIQVKYNNEVNKQEMGLNLGEFKLEVNDIDLPNQKIDLEELELNNTSIVYAQHKTAVKDTLLPEKLGKKVGDEFEQEQKESGKPWSVSLASLKMITNSLKFDDYNVPAQTEGMDFKHLKVDGLAMDIADIAYSGLEVSADINQFVFREKSGFRIEDFSTKVRLDSTSGQLADFSLKTRKTHLKDHLEIGFRSLTSIADELGDLKVNVNLDNSVIAFEDLLYFQPALAANPPFAGNEEEVIRLNGKLKGKVSDLSIPNFELTAMNSTVLKASGRIKGLPEIEKTHFDMKVPQLSTTSSDINDLLPANTLPTSISIPPSISVAADFTGYLNNFDADARVNTSYGNMTANINMNPPVGGREVYEASVRINRFDLGKLMKNDSLYGPVTFRADIDGRGFSPENIAADLKASVVSAEYSGYTYSNLDIIGKVVQKSFKGKINYSDSNLVFAFNGDLNFNENAPKLKFTFDLKGADLNGLKLVENDLRVKTKIKADIVGIDMNNLNGNLGIQETIIIKEGRTFNIDNFLFASINEKRKTDIKIESDLLDAKFAGTINLGDLAKTVQQHINRYFNLNDSELKEFTEEQNFNFSIAVKNSDLLTEVLVPGLTKFRQGEIAGTFNSKTHNLDINIDMPEVGYSNIIVRDFNFKTSSNANALDYNLAIANITQDSTEINNINLGGEVKDDVVSTAFTVSDDEGKEKYLIGGLLQSVEKAFRFKFDQMVLNYDQWRLNDNNYLQFGGGKFFANEVRLVNNNQQILLNSVNREEKVPDFLVQFKDFQLDFISGLTQNDAITLGGILNGDLILEKFPGGATFTSDLKINNFSFKEDTVGNISLLASNRRENQYDVDLGIQGNGNNIKVAGYYLAKSETNALNFNVNIASLNLASIESFTAGQATRMSGVMTGNLKLGGSTSSPSVNGAINFREAGFNITYLKSYFLIDNESIDFDGRGIHFNSFTIKDEKNNTASIDGSVLTRDFSDFRLQLDLTTNDFRLLNTGEGDNEMFYGNVLVDSRIKVRGDLNNPRLDANIKLENATNFTFVIPESDPGEASRDGIVEFVDYSNKINPIIKKEVKSDTIKSEFQGINLTAAISIDKDAQFNIIIDKVRGDVLNLKGRTDEMVFAMDESGKITLSGRYVVNEGNYKLSLYNLVNRNFALRKGSTLVWAGDPLDAQVDISAIYTVETNSSNLVIGEDDPIFNRKLPYQVYLNMKNDLLKPDISFDIKLEDQASVDDRIRGALTRINASEAEKNQQVFALIILGGFIQDNSLQTGNAGGLRGSLSQVLTQQLNKLSDKYLAGFEVNVGVDSYEGQTEGGGTQGRTDLNVDVSKQLFDERVEVQVGSNLNLEGGNAANESSRSSGNIVGDMAILYKLTENGRWRLKAFRETDYDQTMQGDVIKMGASILFIREYNKLKELFRKSEEDEEAELIEEE